jgi:hypothetical protein
VEIQLTLLSMPCGLMGGLRKEEEGIRWDERREEGGWEGEREGRGGMGG